MTWSTVLQSPKGTVLWDLVGTKKQLGVWPVAQSLREALTRRKDYSSH